MIFYCKQSKYIFWFFDDIIDIETDKENDLDGLCTVSIECYIEAHNLGYHIPQFKNLK